MNSNLLLMDYSDQLYAGQNAEQATQVTMRTKALPFVGKYERTLR